MAPQTAPNPLNYFLGRGNVYTSAVDTTSWLHIGNCPKFSVKATTEVIKHNFVTADGVAVPDAIEVKTKSLAVSIDADEMVAETLMLALGATDIGSAVYRVDTPLVFRAVMLAGTNTQGAPVQLFLPKVLFGLDTEAGFISQDLLSLPLTGEAMYWPRTPGGTDYTFCDAHFI